MDGLLASKSFSPLLMKLLIFFCRYAPSLIYETRMRIGVERVYATEISNSEVDFESVDMTIHYGHITFD